jgi:hypothetical protein
MAPASGITTSAYFRTLGLLHLALIMGQIVFALMAFVVKLIGAYDTAALAPELYNILLYLAPGTAVLGIGTSWLVFSSRVKSLRSLSNPADQYTGYRSACILRYAILEAPSLVALVCFILTGDYLFLTIPAFIILVFFLIRPTKMAYISHIQPGYDQQLLLDDPHAVLY